MDSVVSLQAVLDNAKPTMNAIQDMLALKSHVFQIIHAAAAEVSRMAADIMMVTGARFFRDADQMGAMI